MSGPPGAVAAMRAAVRDELADLDPGSLVLVACSGGADSLALAAVAAFVAPRAGLEAGAVVVDHGLQAGSADVAQRAAEQCRALGLDPVEVVSVQVEDPGRGGGPEAAARTARYAALEHAAERHAAVAVLLGHTLDDQAESVLLGLARGSGGRSLSGMPRRRGVLRRPVLGLRRSVTEEACALLGLEPWHDPTNGGPPSRAMPGGADASLPLRSRVRHEVLPRLEAVLGPGVAEALARTADQLRQDGEVLDHLAADVLRTARAEAADTAGTAGTADVSSTAGTADAPDALDVAVLLAAPAALRSRALRAALVAAGCPAGALRSVHIKAVEALVSRWTGQGPVSLPGGHRALRRCGTLVLLSNATQGAARGGCLGHG